MLFVSNIIKFNVPYTNLSEKSEQAVEKLKDAVVTVVAIVCNIKITIATIATKHNISTSLVKEPI